jgi:type II secretory pathway pseudopilin PulG
MVSKQSVDEQLENLGFKLHGWGRAEIRELPHILLPGEEIYELVNGIYEGGFALAVATDVRVLLVDKKPMNYLTVEDIRFDMISEIDYSHRLLGAHIHISTGLKDLSFRSYNQQRLRKLIGHVQHCMAAAKKQQTQSQVGQNQHLERINQQLQTYLRAQSDYQFQLQRSLTDQQSTSQDVPAPSEPTPSHELSDYLFARSLLEQYKSQAGENLKPDFIEEANLPAGPAISEVAMPSNADLHDLWYEGVKEIFSKRHHPGLQSKNQSVKTKQLHNSFEINPVNIAFSKLPAVIRNRRFSRRLKKLSSENASS